MNEGRPLRHHHEATRVSNLLCFVVVPLLKFWLCVHGHHWEVKPRRTPRRYLHSSTNKNSRVRIAKGFGRNANRSTLILERLTRPRLNHRAQVRLQERTSALHINACHLELDGSIPRPGDSPDSSLAQMIKNTQLLGESNGVVERNNYRREHDRDALRCTRNCCGSDNWRRDPAIIQAVML
ncbi:unannotated protein [freshwater metagenome]|uniref:Unannotated protein n=1 Tax=freshwater metagenome TaxID=449393 RepID=A0A6J7R1P9_9ZZZZ